MQPVRNVPALRAVDGGLKDPEIHLSLPGRHVDAGEPGDALAATLRAVVPGVRVRRSEVQASLPARLAVDQ